MCAACCSKSENSVGGGIGSVGRQGMQLYASCTIHEALGAGSAMSNDGAPTMVDSTTIDDSPSDNSLAQALQEAASLRQELEKAQTANTKMRFVCTCVCRP
jgi:hypothetical protein